MKRIFLSSRRPHEVKQRPGTCAPANTDDDPVGGATPIVLPVPATDEQILVAAEQPHRPWLIQGMRHGL